ncbi:DUF2510 domain-containing protein [Microbacterium saperdae]
MTTPAGWYDDGSGRQRWWDGQQWTEHFAPEAAAPVEAETAAAAEVPTADAAAAYEPPASEAPASEAPASEAATLDEPSIDDTVIRPTDETATTPAAQDWSAPSTAPAASSDPNAFADQGATAATTPLDDGIAAYAPPATPGYPGSAPAYPGAYSAAPTGYPAAAPYGQAAPEGPKKVSVLGLVGLGLGVLGTILVFIPVIGFIGFIVLAAGFIVSLISLFLKGKKWPGITGLILAVVGTIIGIVMSFIYLFAFAQGVSSEIDNLPTSSPSIEATAPSETDEGTTGTGRPTVEEVTVGITEILQAVETEALTPEQITCVAGEFVASDIPDDTLRVIASGADETFLDVDAVTAFTDEITEAIPACLVP